MSKPEQKSHNKLNFMRGDISGPYGFVYIEEAPPVIRKNNNLRRRAVFRCKCGKEKEYDLSSINTGSIKSCGCWKSIPEHNANYRHGRTKTRAYETWCGVKKRCYNKKSSKYQYYGGRGIALYEPWIKDSNAFCEYVSALNHYNEDGYSLDRIDNNKNYEPGNLRWATQSVQVRNSGERSNNHSGYRGVHKIKNAPPSHKAYMSYIRAFGKQHYLGVYHTAEEAVGARNNFIIKHGLWDYTVQAIPDYLIY